MAWVDQLPGATSRRGLIVTQAGGGGGNGWETGWTRLEEGGFCFVNLSPRVHPDFHPDPGNRRQQIENAIANADTVCNVG